jgi:glycosyltransferase Alg8
LGAPNDQSLLAQLGAKHWNKEFPWLRQYLAPVSAIEGRRVTLATTPGFKLPAGSRVEPVDPVWGIVLQGFTVRHEIPNANPESVHLQYKNTFPRYAVDAISFEWAAYSGARDLNIEMAGRHPISVENSYGIAMERLNINGAWNKGDGGAGYVRFARSYRSALTSSTIRGIRHLAFQWSAAHNLIRNCRIEVDVNFHGGFSHHNLVEDSDLTPLRRHPWPAVVRTPSDAHWASPDGPGNIVRSTRQADEQQTRSAAPQLRSVSPSLLLPWR